MSTRSLLASLVLVVLWPALPGAGCTAHYAASITAEVSGGAGPVVILYARHGERPRSWAVLRDCDDTREPAPSDVVRVSGCTHYVGIDYEIDIMAVEDRNGNGKLDVGERYGLWADGPLVREREKKVGALRIAIDRVLARGEDHP